MSSLLLPGSLLGFEVFLEIPFAIFAKLKNPFEENKTNFLCLGSVFNDTFYKKDPKEVFSD